MKSTPARVRTHSPFTSPTPPHAPRPFSKAQKTLQSQPLTPQRPSVAKRPHHRGAPPRNPRFLDSSFPSTVAFHNSQHVSVPTPSASMASIPPPQPHQVSAPRILPSQNSPPTPHCSAQLLPPDMLRQQLGRRVRTPRYLAGRPGTGCRARCRYHR